MPDYDLGTAHGKIQIDGDDRGVSVAKNALDRFETAMDKVVVSATAFNASMDKVEAQLKEVTEEYKKAQKAADDFDRSVDGVTGSINVNANATRNASRSTADWANDFITLRRNVDVTTTAISKLTTASSRVSLIARSAKAFDAFGGQDKPITAVTKAFLALGGASSVANVVKRNIFGIDSAMSRMPLWQRQVVGFAGSINSLSKVFNLTQQTSNLGKIWSSAIGAVAKSNQDAALSMVKFGDSVKEFARPLEPAIQGVSRLSRSVDEFAAKPAKMIQGLALMKSGLSGLSRDFGIFTGDIHTGSFWVDSFAKALRFIMLPGIVLSAAALEAFGKSLVFVSNTIAGLWDGIKQLSGGFLALPGLIATIGAVALPAVVVVKNLTAAFKTLGQAKGDVDKINQAIAAMPPYMRPLAQTIVDLTDKWKGFQDTLTATFIQGAQDQLKALANSILPQVSSGSIQVANSFRMAKDGVVAFLGEARTMTAMLTIFANASQIMNTFTNSIGPVGGAFRDIATVGSTFIKQLAEDYIPGIASGFANWAKAAVDSGRAMSWMNGSIEGVKNLVRGLDEALKATYNFLTVFKSGPQTNWLKSFADEMTKFDNAVTKSATSGDLGKISNWIRQLGSQHITALKDIFKDAEPGIRAFVSILNEASAALNTVMIPTIKAAIAVVTPLLQLLSFAGVGSLIGGEIFGIAGAFKVLMFTIMPVYNGLKAVYGAIVAFKAMSGFTTAVQALAVYLENLGGWAEKAGGAILGLGTSVISAAGLITTALALVVGGFVAWQAQSQFVENANKVISDSSKQATDNIDKLRQAFSEDRGVAGSHVLGAEQKGIQDMLDNTTKLAGSAPSLFAQIGASLKNFNPFGSGDSIKQFDQLDDITHKAGMAQQAFSQLGLTSQQLAQQMLGQVPGFDETINKLESMGANGAQAADQLLEMKKSSDLIAASARDAGPGALQLSDAIQKIADAGNNAESKLQGLKEALESLGLLKQDSYEAALNLGKAIDDLGNAAATAADKSQPLNDILGPNGVLNVQAGANARNLYNAVSPIAEAFLKAASSGQDLSGFLPKMYEGLGKLRDEFGLDKEAFDKFIASLGIDPKIVSILVQIKDGGNPFHNELLQLLATAQSSVGNGVEVPVHLKNAGDAKKLADDINAAVGNKGAARADNGNVFLAPGINQAEIDAIAARNGINLGTAPPPPAGVGRTQVPKGQPGPAPVVPQGAPPPAPKKGEPGYVPPPEPARPPAPEHLPPGMPQPLLPPNTKGQRLPNPAYVAPAVPAAPGVAPAAAAAPATLATNITVTGSDNFNKAMSGVMAGINQAKEAWKDFQAVTGQVMAAVSSSIDKLVSSALLKLNGAAAQAKAAGVKFSMDFAAGISSPAALKAISDAAIRAANEAAKKMPHSPAEEGPLSGDGWSGFAGKKFSTDFAGGVEDGVSNISSSVKKAAAAAKLVFDGLTKGVPDNSKNFLKQIQDLTTLASNFQKAATGAFNTGAKLLTALSDPMKTGGFFGQALGYERDKKVTDADLANRRQQGDSGVGQDLTGGAAALTGTATPSKEDIAAAIAGEATKRGYDRNTAIAAISAAMQESGINPNITNASGHHGLFQQSSDKPLQANAGEQIQWFFNQLDQLGGPGNAALKADPLDTVASQIERGGYGGATLGAHANAAATLYDSVIGKAGAVGVGPQAGIQSGQGFQITRQAELKKLAGITTLNKAYRQKELRRFISLDQAKFHNG